MDQLDDLPAPDYQPYFQHAEDLGVLPRVGLRDVWLPDRDGAEGAGGVRSITARSVVSSAGK